MAGLKIGLITYTISFGGVGTFLLSLGERLKEKGHDVAIICTDQQGVWFPRIREVGLKSDFLNFGWLGWIPLGRMIHSFRVGRLIKQQNFDVVVINHSYFAQVSAGMYKPPASIISVIHNQFFPVVKAGCINYQALDAIVCVGPRVYEEAAKIVPVSKLRTIINGVRLPVADKMKGRQGHSNPFRLLFVGRFDNHQKGIFLLTDIVKALVIQDLPIELTLVGDGPDRTSLMAKFREAGVISSIDYRGLLANEEVYRLYANHHVLLLPSNFEGLPLTLIEAMGCGCVPVVSLLAGSTDICVEEGRTGYLVKTGDAQGFAERINTLYRHENLWRQMSVEAIKTANQKFSINSMVEQYLELVDQVISGNDKSTRAKLSKIDLGSEWWKEIVPYYLIMKVKKHLGKRKNNDEIG